MAEIFRRVEKKYILDKAQYEKILPELKKYMDEDKHGESTICNVYFDNESYDLIRHSITKPYYKEKVRVRSYNTPTLDSKVYLEIKRKVNKVVGKRRIEMKLNDFYNYLNDKDSLEKVNPQIKKELDYTFKYWDLKPKMYISYERVALYEKNNNDFRATFDKNILARRDNLNLEKGSYGTDILGKGLYVLEIKTLGTIPLWFAKLINELEIKPGNFSKYGEAYEQLVMNKNVKENVISYAFEKQNSNESADVRAKALA